MPSRRAHSAPARVSLETYRRETAAEATRTVQTDYGEVEFPVAWMHIPFLHSSKVGI
jgi:hypothetical protein